MVSIRGARSWRKYLRKVRGTAMIGFRIANASKVLDINLT